MHKRQELDPRLFELHFSESIVDEWVVSDFFEERVLEREGSSVCLGSIVCEMVNFEH